MDWTAPIDGYCERLSPGLWAEPLNAVTNLAFLLAAWIAWRRVSGQGDPLAVALTGTLAMIGVGSGLFHTVATPWASLADTLPILGFILIYVFAANAHFLALSRGFSALLTFAVLPYMAVFTWAMLYLLPAAGVNATYFSVAVLIFAYGAFLRRHRPKIAQGLVLGAALLSLSITLRALDEPVCGFLPVGTHFLWHLLNAILLCHMIFVYRRARLAKRVDRR